MKFAVHLGRQFFQCAGPSLISGLLRNAHDHALDQYNTTNQGGFDSDSHRLDLSQKSDGVTGFARSSC
jgi:hypothetical protein